MNEKMCRIKLIIQHLMFSSVNTSLLSTFIYSDSAFMQLRFAHWSMETCQQWVFTFLKTGFCNTLLHFTEITQFIDRCLFIRKDKKAIKMIRWINIIHILRKTDYTNCFFKCPGEKVSDLAQKLMKAFALNKKLNRESMDKMTRCFVFLIIFIYLMIS